MGGHDWRRWGTTRECNVGASPAWVLPEPDVLPKRRSSTCPTVAARSSAHSSPSTTRRAWRPSRGAGRGGVSIVSTGSTAKTIAALGIAVTPVEELTGFPECLEGRVKTLHPKVHAGILADTRKPDHVQQLAELGVEAFELVVVNLYPFRETVASGASEDECIEQIDIGGPRWCEPQPRTTPALRS